MSNRSITLILPSHNSMTVPVLLAIIESEGAHDNQAKISEYATITSNNLTRGFESRKDAEGYSDVFQTSNLHVTISPDKVSYKRGKYRPQTIRVQISAYSCDPYGREAIARIVEQSATRY